MAGSSEGSSFFEGMGGVCVWGGGGGGGGGGGWGGGGGGGGAGVDLIQSNINITLYNC